ncbi:hypothetical protein MTO96_030352 [Rhipicephalus appendiculatus]
MVVSTKGAANARQKWLELLESSKRSKSSQEPLAETTENSPRERLGRAMVTSGNDGDTSAPLSPPKKAAFGGTSRDLSCRAHSNSATQ